MIFVVLWRFIRHGIDLGSFFREMDRIFFLFCPRKVLFETRFSLPRVFVVSSPATLHDKHRRRRKKNTRELQRNQRRSRWNAALCGFCWPSSTVSVTIVLTERLNLSDKAAIETVPFVLTRPQSNIRKGAQL